MRGKTKTRYSPRPSKRKAENDYFEPKLKRSSRPLGTNDQDIDKCCWICHSLGYDIPCKTCTRVFHDNCLKKKSLQFSELRVCTECQLQSVDGTELNSKYFSAEKLKVILSTVTRRCFAKKRDKIETFVRWSSNHGAKIGKIIDLEILLDYANKAIYTKTAEFYSDIKYLYHNSCIGFGVNSEEAKAAEQLRKLFEVEILCVEECPECYYYLYNPEAECDDPFVRLCDPPHDIVWAQLTGHPYWPAKCLKVIKGFAHVRFFGEHEQSTIPIGKCFFMSQNHPNPKFANMKNSGPKSRRYKIAKEELEEYIQLYEQIYGQFPFHPHKTPYKPLEKRSEVLIMSTEGRFNSHQTFALKDLTSMKLEGHEENGHDTYEDLQANIINSEARTSVEGTAAFIEHPQNNSSSHTNQAEGTTNMNGLHLGPFIQDNEGNLLDGSSVNSVAMTFFADEATADIANPVLSIRSKSADTVGNTLPISTTNQAIFNLYPELNEVTTNEGFKNTDSVHQININSEKTTCNLMMGSGDNSHSSNLAFNNASIVTEISNTNSGIGNNFHLGTENQSCDSDDEVCYLGQKSVEDLPPVDVDLVLDHLMGSSDTMKFIFEKVAYATKAMLIEALTHVSTNPAFMGLLSKVATELRKGTDERDKLLIENRKLRIEAQNYKETLEENRKLLAQKMEFRSKMELLEKEKDDATRNAKMIMGGLKVRYEKSAEEKFNMRYETAMKDRDKIVHEKEEEIQSMEILVKKLEEEKNRLQIELEDIKVKQRIVEDKLQSSKLQISSDAVSEYKRTHYCCICERSAAIVCCVNHSYCSLKCQDLHFKEHSKYCTKRINQNSVVQQTQQIEYMRVVQKQNITVGTSSVDNPSTSISHAESSTTHHKKEQICHVSASASVRTAEDVGSSASTRACHWKNKRRYPK